LQLERPSEPVREVTNQAEIAVFKLPDIGYQVQLGTAFFYGASIGIILGGSGRAMTIPHL
jgi:hypothetical protein